MIREEEIKLSLDGLDVYDFIQQYAGKGFSAIAKEHFMLMRWYGIYQQKPNEGHFMLRVKVGGGQITSAQFRELARISHEFGRDLADITTRQNIQFHWLTIENLYHIIERINTTGLTTSGACGDITRNVVGCPIAGLNRYEIVDATPVLHSVVDRFLGNKKYSNLPRKFKISISGCHLGCAQPQINDIGVVAVRNQTDPTDIRYTVMVGGGLSTTPKFAQHLNILIETDEVVDVCEEICGIFRDYGNRENRKRARMKFLVEQWGALRFREELEKRLGRKLTNWNNDFRLPDFKDDDHVGIHPQKQAGFYFIGVPVKTGRLSSEQMHCLADTAEKYGKGRLRLTNHQNAIIPDVPESAIEMLCKELAAVGLDPHASQVRRLLVSCTGAQFCNLALTETKDIASRMVEELEKVVPSDEGFRIHVSGCPNSCGQFQTGDIGLTGVTFQKKGEEEKTEAFNIFAGGNLGENPTFGRKLALKVPKDQVPAYLVGIYRRFSANRKQDETFQQFCSRLSDQELSDFGSLDGDR